MDRATPDQRATGSPTPTVPSVRGPVPVTELGVTLMHEHVFVLSSEFVQNDSRLFDEERRVDDAVRRLSLAVDRGVRTLVDLTALGQGRYVPRVARVAAQVDLNILVATGVYTFHDEPFHYFFRGPGRLFDGPDPMTETFVREIVDGIDDTGIRPAMLKCATENAELSPGVDRVLRAVAQAHRQTGVPISTHSNAMVRNGLEQQRVFAEEGVDLSRVVIGHSGDSSDLDYLRGLMDAGSSIGMDRFGMDIITPHDERVRIVAELAAQGYADQMVLSHDCPCFIDFFTEQQRHDAMPDWDYTHLHDRVLPALRARGVTGEQLTTMLVDNPRRILSTTTSY